MSEGKKARCLHEAASRMARQLVAVIEDALLHWELGDVEREFYEVILSGLKELQHVTRTDDGSA